MPNAATGAVPGKMRSTAFAEHAGRRIQEALTIATGRAVCDPKIETIVSITRVSVEQTGDSFTLTANLSLLEMPGDYFMYSPLGLILRRTDTGQTAAVVIALSDDERIRERVTLVGGDPLRTPYQSFPYPGDGDFEIASTHISAALQRLADAVNRPPHAVEREAARLAAELRKRLIEWDEFVNVDLTIAGLYNERDISAIQKHQDWVVAGRLRVKAVGNMAFSSALALSYTNLTGASFGTTGWVATDPRANERFDAEIASGDMSSLLAGTRTQADLCALRAGDVSACLQQLIAIVAKHQRRTRRH